MKPGALENTLSMLPFFARLRPDERVRIADRFAVQTLDAGTTLELAAAAPEMVVVIDGQLQLAVPDCAPSALFAGDVLGELDVVVGRGVQGKLTASAPSQVARLDRAGLDS